MRRSSIVVVSCLAACVLQAQETRTRPPYVRTHGESTISVDPDQAQIDIGVITQGATPDAAADANARQAKIVTEELKAAAPRATIKTANFSVNPNYRYPKDGGAPSILGYTANNTVRVELDDIAVLSKIIEVATKSGASNVNRLNFTLKDQRPFRARALGEAATQALASAEALAKSLNLKVGSVLEVEEGQPVVVSPGRQIQWSRAESNAETPITPGNIDVHASVNITFELVR